MVFRAVGETEGLAMSQGPANTRNPRGRPEAGVSEVMDGGCLSARTMAVNALLDHRGALRGLWFPSPRETCCVPAPDPS